MITRRHFLSALAALPLVGRWMPKPEPTVGEIRPMTIIHDADGSYRAIDRRAGISMRLVDKWDITPDPDPVHLEAEMGKDGELKWYRVARIKG